MDGTDPLELIGNDILDYPNGIALDNKGIVFNPQNQCVHIHNAYQQALLLLSIKYSQFCLHLSLT